MSEDSLYHHGIKGQRWGVRRFQNEDGTLTTKGKKHYGVSDDFDGRILSKKKTKFYRITNNKEDTTYDRLLELGYDGIEDFHGRNTSKDPVIVFNPEKNLKKVSTTRYK